MNEEDKKIMREIRDGYDCVAEKFSQTRSFWWPELEFLRELAGKGDRVLDFGCGNGRLYGFLTSNKPINYLGVDVSEKLIEAARANFSEAEFLAIDPFFEKLPFSDASFDAIFSVAVFHHFPSDEYEQKILAEFQRLLKPGGILVITVWNLYQKKFAKYFWNNLKGILSDAGRFSSGARSGAQRQKSLKDFKIPFRAEGLVFERHHHAYTARELRKNISRAGFNAERIERGKNLVIIARKA